MLQAVRFGAFIPVNSVYVNGKRVVNKDDATSLYNMVSIELQDVLSKQSKQPHIRRHVINHIRKWIDPQLKETPLIHFEPSEGAENTNFKGVLVTGQDAYICNSLSQLGKLILKIPDQPEHPYLGAKKEIEQLFFRMMLCLQDSIKRAQKTKKAVWFDITAKEIPPETTGAQRVLELLSPNRFRIKRIEVT